jgi:type I restriction enzyme S subunit
MKDSGITWVGKIPDNWSIRKLNSIAPIITDFVASGSFADLAANVKYLDSPDYAMLVRTADLSGTRDNIVYIDEHAYNFLSNSNLFGGEVILSNIGSVGNVFYFEPTYKRNSLAPNAIMINGCENNRFIFSYDVNVSFGNNNLTFACAGG